MKTLFTSNHEKNDTKIIYCCSSFNKPCVLKAKNTDILILVIYANAVQQPEQEWCMQTDKDFFVSIRNIYEKVGSTTCLLLPQFHYNHRLLDVVSYFFNVSKQVVLERASSGITTFDIIIN